MKQHQRTQLQQYERLRLNHNGQAVAAMYVILLRQFGLVYMTTSANKQGLKCLHGNQAQLANVRAQALNMTNVAQAAEIQGAVELKLQGYD